MNGKQIIKILVEHGWTLERGSGSHHIMEKDGRAVPIPVHGPRDIGKDLLAKIQRQTGVKIK